MTNNPFLEIARIVEDWEDGHDGEFPKLLCYDPKQSDKPFLYRKGCGFGSFGGKVSLRELFDKQLAQEFKHPETQWIFELLEREHANGHGDHSTGAALIKAYTEKFGEAPKPPVF